MPSVVKVLAFAGARDVLGAASIDLDLAGATTVGSLVDRLCLACPALAAYRPSLRVAVNERYARDGDPVGPGDEVALIPPVAGG
jgi:molybdopterin synthase catalytic subunit/molybdopterin synthase sulfur carrier subunit